MRPLTAEEQEVTRLACVACGKAPDQLDEGGAWFRCEPDPIVGAWSRFDPLRVNGDAFVLMATLSLSLEWSSDLWEVRVDAPTGHHHTEFLMDFPAADAAARRAIVECAAKMPAKDTTA